MIEAENFWRNQSLVLVALLKYAASLILVSFVATALVVLAPGFGTDERELDARLANSTIEDLRTENPGLFAAYFEFVSRAVQGDMGFSSTLNSPVRELIGQRYATTLQIAGAGWAVGWASALLLACSACVFPGTPFRAGGTLAASLLLCLPSALLAFGIAVAQAPAFYAVAVIIFARVFPVLDNLFRASWQSPHVTAARAAGITGHRVFARHTLTATCPELVALAGTSVAVAIGCAVPVEVLCDQPGLGQLAWKAALGRDLPLLVSVTMTVAAITMFFNRGADGVVNLLRRRSS
jgi:peptide/nickel transport system permease protein